MSHERTCPAYGNYQPPYEDCDCGEDERADARRKEREAFRMDELDAVMLSVDKWLDYPEEGPKPNPATRAAEAREVALRTIENLRRRVDRLNRKIERMERR